MTLLLTPAQVGSELQISGRAVYDLIDDFSLPAIRIGAKRRIRIRRADLTAWINAHQTVQELGAALFRGKGRAS